MMQGLTQTRPNDVKGYASEIKRNCFVYQQIAPISALTIQELIRLIDGIYALISQWHVVERFLLKRPERTRISSGAPSLPSKEKRYPWVTFSRVATGSCAMGSVAFAS